MALIYYTENFKDLLPTFLLPNHLITLKKQSSLQPAPVQIATIT